MIIVDLHVLKQQQKQFCVYMLYNCRKYTNNLMSCYGLNDEVIDRFHGHKAVNSTHLFETSLKNKDGFGYQLKVT